MSSSSSSSSPLVIGIGVDGGGTSTTLVAVDMASTEHVPAVLAQVTSGCTNFNSIGRDVAKANLHAGFDALLSKLPASAIVRSVCLGMSGCNTPEDAVVFRSWAESYTFPNDADAAAAAAGAAAAELVVTAYNDSVAALASGTLGDLCGIVLISGTGMIVFGRNAEQREWVTGGNGALIDDGSGFAIGIDVMRAAFAAADGMGPSPQQTTLHNRVLAHLQLKQASELVPWLYGELQWAKVATLAPIAMQAAEQDGDAVALAILHKHADYLIRAVDALVRKLAFAESSDAAPVPVPVVMTGGILQNSIVYERVREGILRSLPRAQLTYPRVDPAHGAALLARKQWLSRA